jgi:hypothetical protein
MCAAGVSVIRSRDRWGGLGVRVGVPLADVYLEFLGGRCRPNTVLAAAYDLKVFFSVVGKPPGQVRPGDVLAFITAQRAGGAAGHGVLQTVDPEDAGVSAATVRRRLSIVSGFFSFLQARGDVEANPVPRGLPTRRERSRPRQGVPLVRATRKLPRILAPAEVDALTAALRTHRDRAMVAAMVLGGLRRCEVLGCDWKTCTSLSGGCSSPRARAAGNRVKFMIRDRGPDFTAAFDAVLADAGIRTVLCNVRTPRMNAITGRWIGGCRRELLNRILVWNQAQLRRILREYETHHNQHRPHRSLHGAAPLKTATRTGQSRSVPRPKTGSRRWSAPLGRMTNGPARSGAIARLGERGTAPELLDRCVYSEPRSCSCVGKSFVIGNKGR